MWKSAYCFSLLVSLSLCSPIASLSLLANDIELTALDRQTLPASDHAYYYYFSLEPIPRAEQLKTAQVLAFVVASSSQQQAIEYCTPTRIGETLYRIDTRNLKWDASTLASILAQSPYKRADGEGPMLIQHPGWFIQHVADSTESDAYNQLLYGKAKITRDEWLALWKTNDDPFYRVGYVEGDSGVSVQRIRWLMNFPNAIRTDVWGTLDFLKVDHQTDPLANLDYPVDRWRAHPIHDGEEWIAGLPKYSHSQRGRLQAYLLSDKAGKSVTEAPGRLVIDRQRFRNHGVIVNFGGCVACHSMGLRPLTTDAVSEYLLSGATISTKDKQQAVDIDKLVLSPTEKLIEDANAEYAIGCKLVCGLEPADLTTAFVECIEAYDAPVTLPIAAAELYATTAELRLAIAYRETKYNDLHPRQAALAKEQAIPRKVWEGIYYDTYCMLRDWRAATTDAGR